MSKHAHADSSAHIGTYGAVLPGALACRRPVLCDKQQTVPNCVATCSCLCPAGLCNAISSPSSSTNHFNLTAAAEQQHSHTAAVCEAALAAASSLCEGSHQRPVRKTTRYLSQPCSTCRQHGTSSHSATARTYSNGECHAHTAAGEKAPSARLPAWSIRQVDLSRHAVASVLCRTDCASCMPSVYLMSQDATRYCANCSKHV